jgi:hypothetical protein
MFSVFCCDVLNRHHRNYFAFINRIAFGVGDGAVRIWNLSNPTSLEITSLQQQKKAKIMAVSVFYIFQFMNMYHIGRMTVCSSCSTVNTQFMYIALIVLSVFKGFSMFLALTLCD